MPKNQEKTITLTLNPRTASAVLTALSVTVEKVVEDFAKDGANAPEFIREVFMRPRSEALLSPLQEVGETVRKAANEAWADDAEEADADAPDYDADEQPQTIN